MCKKNMGLIGLMILFSVQAMADKYQRIRFNFYFFNESEETVKIHMARQSDMSKPIGDIRPVIAPGQSYVMKLNLVPGRDALYITDMNFDSITGHGTSFGHKKMTFFIPYYDFNITAVQYNIVVGDRVMTMNPPIVLSRKPSQKTFIQKWLPWFATKRDNNQVMYLAIPRSLSVSTVISSVAGRTRVSSIQTDTSGHTGLISPLHSGRWLRSTKIGASPRSGHMRVRSVRGSDAGQPRYSTRTQVSH